MRCITQRDHAPDWLSGGEFARIACNEGGTTPSKGDMAARGDDERDLVRERCIRQVHDALLISAALTARLVPVD